MHYRSMIAQEIGIFWNNLPKKQEGNTNERRVWGCDFIGDKEREAHLLSERHSHQLVQSKLLLIKNRGPILPNLPNFQDEL